MSERIASLYAEIGADTTGLNKGLQDAKTQLTQMQSSMSSYASLTKQKYEEIAAADEAQTKSMQDEMTFRSNMVKQQYAEQDAAAKQAKQNIENFKQGVLSFTAAAGIAGAAVVQIFNLGKAGAEIEYAANKFDRLALSIGTTSDALNKELGLATDGLMSKAETMQLAGNLMSLGLAKTSDQAVRLTTVASQLGMNMNQLVLTLTNQTTMRFDALGVAVDGFDEKLEKLEATGMSTNDAFTEAFLQQAEEQLEKVGSVADQNIGSFMRMESALKDTADGFKKSLTPAISSAADTVYYMLKGTELLKDTLDEHNTNMIRASTSYQEYSDEMDRAAKVAGMQYDAEGNLVKAHQLRGSIIKTVVQENQKLTESEYDNIHVVGILNGQLQDYAEMAEAVQYQAEAQARSIDNLSNLMSITANNKDYADSQDEIKQKMQATREEMDRLTSIGWSEQSKKVQDLQKDYDNLSAKYAENATAHEDAQKSMMFDLLTQKANVDGLSDAEFGFLTQLAGPEGWGMVDQATLDYATTAAATMDSVTGSVESGKSKVGEFKDLWESLQDKTITLTAFIEMVSDDQTYVPKWRDDLSKPSNDHGSFEATGGPVSAGQSVWVGENGVERFTPTTNGVITANNQLSDPKTLGKLDEIKILLTQLPKQIRDASLIG